MFQRVLSPLLTNSFFLFGARGTGKSTLLNTLFEGKAALKLDLLDPETEERFARNPSELAERINAEQLPVQWVLIDEVQKVPKLLDVVHQLIEKRGIHFVLTGSSSRKLKHGASNLLAGRAFVENLFPLTHLELGERFNLADALNWGTLPKIFQFDHAEEKAQYLRAYALTYLKEEIVSEQLIRKLDPFRSFLEIAAQCDGKILNYSRLARECGADIKTVQSYFTILEDTLIGISLPAFHRSVRKQQMHHPKFIFFDNGISRALSRTLNINVQAGTSEFGMAFERFIINEVHRVNIYKRLDWKLSYLLTREGLEIDLIIERPGLPIALVEIKSSERSNEDDVKHLIRLAKDLSPCELFCVSCDPVKRLKNGVLHINWMEWFKNVVW